MVNFTSSNTIRAAFAACLLLAGTSLSPLAYAADNDTRIRQLEGEIETLSRAVFKGEKPPVNLTPSVNNDYQANLETRLSGLENQIRTLTGKVEQQEFETNQLKNKLDKALSDIDVRFQDSTPKAASTQSGTLAPNDMGGEIVNQDTPLNVVADVNAPASQDSPTVQKLGEMKESPGGAAIPPNAGNDAAAQYEEAFSLLKAGNTKAAREGFDKFIKSNPDHPLVANATYWLGETYYSEGQFDKATRVFAESYKKFPKGPKVGDSLLKMGMSLNAAGKKSEACVTLQQLQKESAVADAVTMRRAKQEMTRIGCE